MSRRSSWSSWIVFFQNHRTITRLFPSRIRDRLVWLELESDPVFRASIAEGLADLAAHRVWRVDREAGLLVPHPDWPEPKPEPQPWP